MDSLPICIDEYKAQWNYIYNFAFKLTGNIHECEDLAQETIIKGWEKIDQLKNTNALKPWLRKICTNLFLMQIRKEKGYKELSYDQLIDLEKESPSLQFESNTPQPDEELILDESIRELRNGCFQAMTLKLTLNQRIVFSLIEMFGLETHEVAERIGLSKSATKSLLHRARMNIDSFFAPKCNLINTRNPCSCQSYLDFSRMKEERKAEVRERITSFKFGEKPKNYLYNDEIRQRVRHIYTDMPENIPASAWYQSVVNTVS